MYKVALDKVNEAKVNLESVVLETPLTINATQSRKFSSSIYLKREDLQQVRSYKIRGAFNKISSLSQNELQKGVVCASAGNHAQGVAFSCSKMQIKGCVFMPTPTPKQKIEQVKMFGGKYVEVILTGDTFDDAFNDAKKYSDRHQMSFIHPFDDCLLYTSPSPRDVEESRMPSSA